MRRDSSPRIEGRKVKGISILTGENILLTFHPALRSSVIKKESVTELSLGDGTKDIAEKQPFDNMGDTKVTFDVLN